jgi:hypothetical protein
MYTIEIDYTHGDSFRSERTELELEYKWTLDIAKENLKRMKEHYKAYSSRNGYVSCMMKKREDELLSQIKDMPWFVAKATYGYGTGVGDWENNIMFKENDGTEKEYTTYTWTDYFATLHGARIVFYKENVDDEDGDDMSFSF